MEQCFNEECMHHISQHGGTCKGLKEHEKCHLFTALKTNKEPVANVLCSGGVILPETLAEDLFVHGNEAIKWLKESMGQARDLKERYEPSPSHSELNDGLDMEDNLIDRPTEKQKSKYKQSLEYLVKIGTKIDPKIQDTLFKLAGVI